ncbi:MAG: N-6 DNA methylase [Clostridium sp.]
MNLFKMFDFIDEIKEIKESKKTTRSKKTTKKSTKPKSKIATGQSDIFKMFQFGSDTQNSIETTKSTTTTDDNSINLFTSILETTKQTLSKTIDKVVEMYDFLFNRENLSTSNKDRYSDNITAIKLVNKLNESNRLATPKEQAIIAKYVGWGGLADKFKEGSNSSLELKTLLGANYDSAKASTLTSFYTPLHLIKYIYKVLTKLGFEKGVILEPSCGTGRLLGAMNEDNYYNSKIVGVEMDKVSSEIAKNLYQSARIINSKYEDCELKDGSFDLILGNVPFGSTSPYDCIDKDLNNHNLLIHDYFFMKSIKKVREGGVIAFITSSGTMDKKTSDVRELISKECSLIGALRLPSGTFIDTEVTTDIIFLIKSKDFPGAKKWTNIKETDDGFTINEYFIEHPYMMLGEMKNVSSQYGEKQILFNENVITSKDLEKTLKYFPSEVYEAALTDEYMHNEEDLIICDDLEIKESEFILRDNNLYQRQGRFLLPINYFGARKQKFVAYIEVKTALKGIIQNQLDDCSDEKLSKLQDELTAKYDSFVKEYGYISSKANKKLLSNDILYYLVSTLEIQIPDTTEYNKSQVFTKRTIGCSNQSSNAETVEDAMVISLNDKGSMDLNYMSELLGKSYDLVVSELREKELIYLDPITNEYVERDIYLSGYVKKKLKDAKLAAENNSEFEVNVEALEDNQPEYVRDVYFNLSSVWIPAGIKEDFIKTNLDINEESEFKILYTHQMGYSITSRAYVKSDLRTVHWGTGRKDAITLVELTLNMKNATVYDTVFDPIERKDKQVKNAEETQLAMSIQDKWKDSFNEYINNNPKLLKDLLDLYNEKFIDYKEREYKNILTNLRINPNIQLREHQLKAASRIITSQNNTLLAHGVGTVIITAYIEKLVCESTLKPVNPKAL